MDRLFVWMGVLAGSFGLVMMCLVMMGQAIRPFNHLLKATVFWFVVTMAAALFVVFGMPLL